MNNHDNINIVLIKTIFEVLREVFIEDNYADKSLERVFKKYRNIKGREKAMVAEEVYDMIRYWRLLTSLVPPDEELSDRSLWNIYAAYIIKKKGRLPNHTKFNVLPTKNIHARLDKFKTNRKIYESIPDWFDEIGVAEFKEDWNDIIRGLNERPSINLRVNTLKTSRQELIEMLEDENIQCSPMSIAPNAIQLSEGRNVFRTEAFQNGLFEVQDAASQKVAELLNVNPGSRVIDACAGAGGKTLHLSALMQNKGKILALDNSEWKLKELRKRASRAGAQNIETKVIDSSKVIKRLKGTADRLLLDVPCTGTGILRRNPDIKWKLNPEQLERLLVQQQEILNSYSQMLKKDGIMVYATCSILPAEGEQQVDTFLKSHHDFKILSEERYWPNVHKTDGFYMACIQKTS